MTHKQTNAGMPSGSSSKNSKIFVLGFLLFIVAVYIGGYFYDKAKNEMKVQYPRLVMFAQKISSPEDYISPNEFLSTPEGLEEAFSKGMIEIITHQEYASGVTDINKKYFLRHTYGQDTGGTMLSKEIIDCIELGRKIDAAKARSQKNLIKKSWAHNICRMPFEIKPEK